MTRLYHARHTVLCVLVLTLQACSGARPPEASRRRISTATLRIVPASLLTTAVWALDAAAGVRYRDPTYRTWLALPTAEPTWLARYRSRRPYWNSRGMDVSVFHACTFESETLADLRPCLYAGLSEEDISIAEDAIRQATHALRGEHARQTERLEQLAQAMRTQIESERGQAFLRWLALESQVPERNLTFNVILLPSPLGGARYAQQLGSYLPCEVDGAESAGERLGVAFHEFLHVAHARSPRLTEMEGVFLEAGEDGLLAGALWNEAVATAFGNGLVAREFNTTFNYVHRMYGDRAIDAFARLLLREWTDDPTPPRLSAEFAQHLVALTRRLPPEARTFQHYLWTATIYAPSVELAEAARSPHARQWSVRPLDNWLTRAPSMPSFSPRVIVVGNDELARRPALMQRVGIDSVPSSPEVFRSVDHDSTMMFLITAPAERLFAAARAFVALPALPGEGWTALASDEPLPGTSSAHGTTHPANGSGTAGSGRGSR